MPGPIPTGRQRCHSKGSCCRPLAELHSTGDAARRRHEYPRTPGAGRTVPRGTDRKHALSRTRRTLPGPKLRTGRLGPPRAWAPAEQFHVERTESTRRVAPAGPCPVRRLAPGDSAPRSRDGAGPMVSRGTTGGIRFPAHLGRWRRSTPNVSTAPDERFHVERPGDTGSAAPLSAFRRDSRASTRRPSSPGHQGGNFAGNRRQVGAFPPISDGSRPTFRATARPQSLRNRKTSAFSSTAGGFARLSAHLGRLPVRCRRHSSAPSPSPPPGCRFRVDCRRVRTPLSAPQAFPGLIPARQLGTTHSRPPPEQFHVERSAITRRAATLGPCPMRLHSDAPAAVGSTEPGLEFPVDSWGATPCAPPVDPFQFGPCATTRPPPSP